jgi:hypothetical protein
LKNQALSTGFFVFLKTVGLCKKFFAAFGGKIFFGWRHLFPDFAKQNQEKDVSIQI